ncbi:unnamed protein product, partial [Thlaspi arvense]
MLLDPHGFGDRSGSKTWFHRRKKCRRLLKFWSSNPGDKLQSPFVNRNWRLAKMNLGTAEEESAQEIHIPADINWEMLDKSKFFVLGAALFSGVSGALYPAVLMKTRQQVCHSQGSCIRGAFTLVRHEGLRGLYRGFGTSLMGTIPARALYMTALEVTKSNVGSAAVTLGFTEAKAAAVANAVGGLTAAMAAQLVWTPVDVVSQRLMVQGSRGLVNASRCNYVNGFDAFRKIVRADGPKGLYRGFGISILTYAPSNAVWWASYSVAQRMVWGGVGCYVCKKDGESGNNSIKPDSKTIMAVQGVSAAIAGSKCNFLNLRLDLVHYYRAGKPEHKCVSVIQV